MALARLRRLRWSLVHYNTLSEVDRLTTALDSILPGSALRSRNT
jgi:selenocysteine lyase/cysteine desulfurase